MSVRVASNGFGRIGRTAFCAAFERGADVEWVAVNDVADTATLAHLLRHDSVNGPFPGTVETDGETLFVDGAEIGVLGVADPADLPWDELGVDVVL